MFTDFFITNFLLYLPDILPQNFGGIKYYSFLKRHQLGYIDIFYVKLCILFSWFNKIIVFLQNQLNNKRL